MTGICTNCARWRADRRDRRRCGRCALTGRKIGPNGSCARFEPVRWCWPRRPAPAPAPALPKPAPDLPAPAPDLPAPDRPAPATPNCGTCWRFEPAPPGRYVGRCTAHDRMTAPYESCREHTRQPQPGAFMVRASRKLQ